MAKRKPSGPADYAALALTTCGVGYIPGAPGTYGSAVAVAIYIGITSIAAKLSLSGAHLALFHAALALSLLLFCLAGIRAAGNSIALLGNEDPKEAIVDEIMGQLITYCFVPLAVGWPMVLAGFLLFRLFDVWKPYPIDTLQALPAGIGVCADDIVAGVYAGTCLSIIYGISLYL